MKKLFSFALAVAMVAAVGTLRAEDLKSGLQPGESIGAYDVEKCAGNANDGVEVGKTLCYRCKLGARPVVAVFARSSDAKVASLLKAIDSVVVHNADKKAASFVNLLGKDADALKTAGKKLIDSSKVENIAIVVPLDNENGPADLKLNPKADVTVLIYNKGKIEANHAIAAGELTEKKIKAIVADADKLFQ